MIISKTKREVIETKELLCHFIKNYNVACRDMQEWLKISLVLCSFGFFREFRPSEPFVTEFLSDSEWRNITSDQLNREVYPIGTYATLTLLVIVFLVTDILRFER